MHTVIHSYTYSIEHQYLREILKAPLNSTVQSVNVSECFFIVVLLIYNCSNNITTTKLTTAELCAGSDTSTNISYIKNRSPQVILNKVPGQLNTSGRWNVYTIASRLLTINTIFGLWKQKQCVYTCIQRDAQWEVRSEYILMKMWPDSQN